MTACSVCGDNRCERMAHTTPDGYPYDGTQAELDTIDQEITDNQRQHAELDRQYRLLQQHRYHAIVHLRSRTTLASAKHQQMVMPI